MWIYKKLAKSSYSNVSGCDECFDGQAQAHKELIYHSKCTSSKLLLHQKCIPFLALSRPQVVWREISYIQGVPLLSVSH